MTTFSSEEPSVDSIALHEIIQSGDELGKIAADRLLDTTLLLLDPCRDLLDQLFALRREMQRAQTPVDRAQLPEQVVGLLQPVEGEDQRRRLGSDQPGDLVLEDSGIGLDDREHGKIHDPEIEAAQDAIQLADDRVLDRADLVSDEAIQRVDSV